MNKGSFDNYSLALMSDQRRNKPLRKSSLEQASLRSEVTMSFTEKLQRA